MLVVPLANYMGEKMKHEQKVHTCQNSAASVFAGAAQLILAGNTKFNNTI